MSRGFTDGARYALGKGAQHAAKSTGSFTIEPEHLLLSVLQTGEIGPLLVRLDLDRRRLKENALEVAHGRRSRGRNPLPDAPVEHSSRTKEVLEHVGKSVNEVGHAVVSTEHLLLGLLRHEKNRAAHVLIELGVSYEAAVRAVMSPFEGPPLRRSSPTFQVRIDHSAEASIYEQIVAQIQEAVATGALAFGDRLPTVRRLADDLEIATGTVARAYSELEKRGFVVTEGTRGTRVTGAQRPVEPDSARPETLIGLLRPVAVAAFHLGATAGELRAALQHAMAGIFDEHDRGVSVPSQALGTLTRSVTMAEHDERHDPIPEPRAEPPAPPRPPRSTVGFEDDAPKPRRPRRPRRASTER